MSGSPPPLLRPPTPPKAVARTHDDRQSRLSSGVALGALEAPEPPRQVAPDYPTTDRGRELCVEGARGGEVMRRHAGM